MASCTACPVAKKVASSRWIRKTGETIWANTKIEHFAAYCSPTIITHRGVRQWVSMTQQSVVSLDPQTGELLWTVPFVPRSPQNALTPVYGDGHVFVAAGHSSGGSLLKIADDSRSAAVVWHREDLDNCHSGSILLDGKLFGAVVPGAEASTSTASTS